jgi:prophage regulatory protein
MSEVFLSVQDLADRYRVNRTTVWRWCQTRGFPAPVKLSPGCARWRLSGVEAWEADRKGEAA